MCSLDINELIWLVKVGILYSLGVSIGIGIEECGNNKYRFIILCRKVWIGRVSEYVGRICGFGVCFSRVNGRVSKYISEEVDRGVLSRVLVDFDCRNIERGIVDDLCKQVKSDYVTVNMSKEVNGGYRLDGSIYGRCIENKELKVLLEDRYGLVNVSVMNVGINMLVFFGRLNR